MNLKQQRNLYHSTLAGIIGCLSLFLFITIVAADEPAWIRTAPLPEGRVGSQVVVFDPNLVSPRVPSSPIFYIIGGESDLPMNGIITSAEQEESGSLRFWTLPTPLPPIPTPPTNTVPLFHTAPTTLSVHASTQVGYDVYIIGGWDGAKRLSDVWYCNLRIGDCTKQVRDYNAKIVLHSALATEKRVYVFGGVNENDTPQDSVYSAKINKLSSHVADDRTLNTWEAEASLPRPLFRTTVVKHTSYIYVIGGFDGKEARKEIYRAKLEDNCINKWETIRPLRRPLYYHAALIVRSTADEDRLVILGGENDGETFDDVYSAKILEDGDLGDWKDERDLPLSLSRHAVLEYRERIYIFGGEHEGVPQSQVYFTRKKQYPKAIGAQVLRGDLALTEPSGSSIPMQDKLIITSPYKIYLPMTPDYTQCRLKRNNQTQ